MASKLSLKRSRIRQGLEKASIFACLVLAMVMFIVGLSSGNDHPSNNSNESSLVTAIATAMPHNGWAPHTVYFSAFGSKSHDSKIVGYEWDLDGDGRFDYDATAQNGYASYSYSKTGERTITLRVTDEEGKTATDSLIINIKHPASSSVDYWSVFDDSLIRRIDVSLLSNDWKKIWSDPEAKYQAKADLKIFGRQLQDVGFRMRGQFSLRVSGSKKPWKFDLDAYIPDQEYQNLKQLLLINNVGDPSLLREKLAYELMEFAGVPASHTAYVELWVDLLDDNEEPIYWGLYTLIERVDNKYIANRFGRDSKGGNLYKASHAQRGPMDLIYYGESITDYPLQDGQYAYGKMNNEDEADYSDIINLCRVVDYNNYSDDQSFMAALEEVINVDTFLRYMAVITILDNWDSYPYTGNNFYLFNNPTTDRFEWIPWDLTWGMNANAPLFGKTGESIIGSAPLFDRVFAIEAYQTRYAAYVDLIVRHRFNPAYMTEHIKNYHRQIKPYINKSTGDQAFYGEEPMFNNNQFDNSWQELISFIENRGIYLEKSLNDFLSSNK